MPLIDLTKISVTSSGTGPLVLGQAVPGFRGLEALTNGETYSYSLGNIGAQYEYGTVTYLSAGTQLIRSPLASSDGGVAINVPYGATVSFTALAKDINPPEFLAAKETAVAAAAAAAASEASATTQAGIATTQAGIATTQAGSATSSAATASTQAGIATTQAGIATTQASAAAASAATVSAALPDSDKQFRKAYVPGPVYVSPRGTADEVGDQTYGSGRFMGFYVQCTKDTIFNTSMWRVWTNSIANAVEWKAYVRSNITPFNPSTTGTPGADDFTYQEGTLPAGTMLNLNVPFVHTLPKPMFCPAGSYVMIFYRDPTSDFINTARWTTVGSPARHGFLQGPGNAGWNQNWAVGTATFYQADPRLMLLDGEYQLEADLSVPDLLCVTPLKKYGVANREINIYWNTMVPDDPASYTFDMNATAFTQKGRQEVERWTLLPTTPVTSGDLVLRVRRRNKNGQQLAQRNIALRIATANAQTGTNKTVLLIGDSLTAEGTLAQTLFDNAAAEPGVMGVTMIGTKVQTGTTTPNPACKSEGVGGVTLDYFNNVASSPFAIGGVIDFPGWLTANGFAVPDYVFIQLGTNDLRTVAFEDPAYVNLLGALNPTYPARYNTLITNIRAAGAGIKIMLEPPPMVFDQDAWGNSWGTDFKAARAKRNLMLWYQMMQANFANLEGSNVYLLGGNTAEDTFVSSPRLQTLRNGRVVVGTTFANMGAMTLTPAHGTLALVTNVNTAGIVPEAGYFVKVGQSGAGLWRPALETDGVMNRQRDSLHWGFNGIGGKQIGDEYWAAMKYLG